MDAEVVRNMQRDWRIIHTEPLDPFQNMAMDEAIFRQYLQDNTPVFRIYGWSVPSVSLGVSQKPEEVLDLELCEKENVPFVKRMTGGGMIFHDREITYSLACSKEDIGCGDTIAGSFKVVCSFLIDFYMRLGLDAGFAVDRAGGERFGAFSEFCFAAKEKYDIVIGRKKIGGNAQKRTREAIFQHGSIPISLDNARAASFLKKKPAAEDINATSLEELLGRCPGREELIPILKGSFEKTVMAQ